MPAPGSSGVRSKSNISSFRRVTDALLALGPFAGFITAYGLLLDSFQDSWFTYRALKYLLAGVCALCFGLILRILGQRFVKSTSSGEAVTPEGNTPIASGATRMQAASPYQILAYTAAAIQADFRTGKHDGTITYGWSQYIADPVPPSAIGTSYGLRIAMALDIRSSEMSYSLIVKSLLDLQRNGGGWAASTQRGIGRPEVTAWVLGAAFRAGLDHEVTATLVKVLENMTKMGDPVALNRTTIISTIVSTLADVAPKSEQLSSLSELLVKGAGSAGEGLSWGEVVDGGPKNSVPHSARAVVALKKAARVLPTAAGLNVAANEGIRWLVQPERSLLATDEQIRRPVGDGDVDALFVGQFSAAWVARAIMTSSNPSTYEDALRRAVREVVACQEEGIWRWHDNTTPIWMTYQGVSVLRDYLLRGLVWPP